MTDHERCAVPAPDEQLLPPSVAATDLVIDGGGPYGRLAGTTTDQQVLTDVGRRDADGAVPAPHPPVSCRHADDVGGRRVGNGRTILVTCQCRRRRDRLVLACPAHHATGHQARQEQRVEHLEHARCPHDTQWP